MLPRPLRGIFRFVLDEYLPHPRYQRQELHRNGYDGDTLAVRYFAMPL